MRLVRAWSAITTSIAFAIAGSFTPAQARSPEGPPLTVAAEDAMSALHCPPSFDPTRVPVLLVHGTGTDSTKWDGNYARLLPPRGFDVCTIDLPAKAMGDIQIASEYVVYAVRWVSRAAGRPVDVIGHSQGAVVQRWAARWWPDVADSIDDAISIAGSNHGTTLADRLCTGPCAAAMWQQVTTSRFVATLNADDETPDGPSWTSIFSADDGAVTPYTSSTLAGGANIEVQTLCPGRSVDHNRMILDAVVFWLALDALTHVGPVDPARFDAGTCAADLAPGADAPPDDISGTVETAEFLATITTASPLLVEEPPVAPYATAPAPTDRTTVPAPLDSAPALSAMSSNRSTPRSGDRLPVTGRAAPWLAAVVLVAASAATRRLTTSARHRARRRRGVGGAVAGGSAFGCRSG